MNSLLRFLSVLAAASVLVALGFVIFDYFQTQERFPTQTIIGRVNVSGFDKGEALQKLSHVSLSIAYTSLVTFETPEQTKFSFSPEAVGISLNLEETVNQAFALTHDEGYLKELRQRLKKGPLRLPLVLRIDDALLASVLEAIAAELRTSAKDASLIFYEETGAYHIESEQLGKELKLDETSRAIKERLAAGELVFPFIIEYSRPRIIASDLRAYPPVHRLSAFTTYYGRHDSPNRIHNIKLIASWVDNTLLLSGETYSLADAIGDFTPEKGFKEAYVIYGGVLVPQLGGGTCQIGTTLFNAVSLADLEILERSNHSFYFNIYPLGRDATIYPGQKDLKFKNDTGHPVLIKTVATNKRLSFRIYGTPTGKTVKFSAPAVSLLGPQGYRPATVREVLDADRPFRTVITRTVYGATGQKLKEEVLHSRYKLYGEKSNVPIARPESR